MAFNYSPKIVTEGLVLCLDAGNPMSYVSGSTTWSDLSRGRNNSTLINGPTFNTGSGGSIVFDGVNDYVNYGNSSLLTVSTQTTLEAWVYGTNWTSSLVHPIISKWGTSGNSYKLAVFGTVIPADQGKLYIDVTGGGTGDNYVTSTTVLNLNTWYHVVGVYNGTSLILYVNSNNVTGALTGTIPSSLYQGTSNVYTGTDGSNNYYSGRIALSKIYNRALSATEVLQNYNATKGRFGLT